MANYGIKGRFTNQEVQEIIIGFLRLKGDEVSTKEIAQFLHNHFEVGFDQINHVAFQMKKEYPNVEAGSKRGYLKLVE